MRKVLRVFKSRSFYLGLLRYLLGLAMLPYAISKLLRLQFVVLPNRTWQLPLEKLSGVALAWAFLGHSGWFQVLLGALELVPALLLLFRRTALLGAVLLLPVLLSVFLINQALDLWPDTQLVSGVLLLLNVGALAFEWGKLRAVLALLLHRGQQVRVGGWEVGLNVLLVAAVAGLMGSQLVDYLHQTNELTGDWYHQHPARWVRQEPAGSSPTAQTCYFGAYGSYEEVNGNTHNPRLTRYQLDRQQRQLRIYTQGDSLARTWAYELPSDSVLTLRVVGRPAGEPAMQVFKRRLIRAGLD